MAGSFAGTTALVTGGRGFIGARLVDALRRRDADVHATSRAEVSGDGVTWWRGEMQDDSFAAAVFAAARPDVVFHLAGDVTADNSVDRLALAHHSLLTSTVNVLTLAEGSGCRRVVLAGSSVEPVGDDPVPNSPYAAAKWATTAYGRMFGRLFDLPVVVVRPFMGYGPGQPSGKVIPFVVDAFRRGVAPQLSAGRWVTDWVYIDDTVAGFLAAATAPDAPGDPIDLGTGTLTSVREVVERVAAIMRPERGPVFDALPDRHQEHTREADVEEARRRIGWTAATSLDEGLRRTVASLLAS